MPPFRPETYPWAAWKQGRNRNNRSRGGARSAGHRPGRSHHESGTGGAILYETGAFRGRVSQLMPRGPKGERQPPCISPRPPLYARHLTRGSWPIKPSGGRPAPSLPCPHAGEGREGLPHRLTGPRRNNRRIPMALPDYSMRQLLEAGVHFGHQSHRWNPKMKDFIFGARNNIHIIDLAQTVPLLHRALSAVSDTVAKGGRILFVGTKRQAQDAISQAAKRSAQYYVNSRWLGGTLTNWKTISESIKRLRKFDEILSSGDAGGYTKK